VPTCTSALARCIIALALMFSVTAAFAMNPVLLKRQTEAGGAGGDVDRCVRLISTEDCAVSRKENRLEALIEVPANASIEGRMIGQPSECCEITTNAKAVNKKQESEGRFYAVAQANHGIWQFELSRCLRVTLTRFEPCLSPRINPSKSN